MAASNNDLSWRPFFIFYEVVSCSGDVIDIVGRSLGRLYVSEVPQICGLYKKVECQWVERVCLVSFYIVRKVVLKSLV